MLPAGLELAFCPTGKGGGIDPTCSPGGSAASAGDGDAFAIQKELTELYAKREEIQKKAAEERKLSPKGVATSATKKLRSQINSKIAELEAKLAGKPLPPKTPPKGKKPAPPKPASPPDAPPAPPAGPKKSFGAKGTRPEAVEFNSMAEASKYLKDELSTTLTKGGSVDKSRIVEVAQVYANEINRAANEFELVDKHLKGEIKVHTFSFQANEFRVTDVKSSGQAGHGVNGGSAIGTYWALNNNIGVMSHLPIAETPTPGVGAGHWTIGGGRMQSVIRHEFGHRIWYKALSQQQRSEFLDIVGKKMKLCKDEAHQKRWKKSKDAAKTLTEYGTSNIKEYYAESFAAITHPNYGTSGKRLLPEIEEFMYATLGKRESVSTGQVAASIELDSPMPEGLMLAFCPTGKGGGIDNSCSSSSGGSGQLASLYVQQANLMAQVAKERAAGGVTAATKKLRAKLNKQIADAKIASGADVPEAVGKIKVLDSNIGGSTGAKKVRIEGDGDYVMKTYGGKEANVKNEYAANKLYEAFAPGSVPETKLGEYEGKAAVFNKFEKVKTLGDLQGYTRQKAIEEVSKNFVVDAWLANWDVAGLEHDNIGVTSSGKVLRLDNGGALAFRAMGSPKGKAFGNSVGELDSMRHGGSNASAHQVFGSLSDKDLAAQINTLRSRMGADPHARLTYLLGDVVPDAVITTLTQRYKNLVEEAKELALSFLPAGLELAFCATGKGGGIDPTCGKASSGHETIELDNGQEVKIHVNPSMSQVLAKIRAKFDAGLTEGGTVDTLRGMVDNEGNLYTWDAFKATHFDVTQKLLGVDQEETRLRFQARGTGEDEDGNSWVHFTGIMTGQAEFADEFPEDQVEEVINAAMKDAEHGIEFSYLPVGLSLAFCPTGKGGGIDNSCSPGGGRGGSGGLNSVAMTPELKAEVDALRLSAKVAKAEAKGVAAKIAAIKATGTTKGLSALKKQRKLLNAKAKAFEKQASDKLMGVVTSKPGTTSQFIGKPPLPPPPSAPKGLTPVAPTPPPPSPAKPLKGISHYIAEDGSYLPGGPKNFKDGGHQEWAKENYSEWVKNLTLQERQALGSYCSSGYKTINGNLRHNVVKADVLDRVIRIDEALRKSPPLKEDLLLHRNAGKMGNVVGKLEVGDVFLERGYVSTSIATKKEPGYGNGATKINLKVPKGNRGAYVSVDGGPGSGYEREFLLPRDTKMKVLAKYEINHPGHGVVTVIDAEVLPDHYVGLPAGQLGTEMLALARETRGDMKELSIDEILSRDKFQMQDIEIVSLAEEDLVARDATVVLPEGLELAFCPTGKGGGVDPTCGKGGPKAAKAVAGAAKGSTKLLKEIAKLEADRDAVKAKIKKVKAGEAVEGETLSSLKKLRAEINREIDFKSKQVIADDEPPKEKAKVGTFDKGFHPCCKELIQEQKRYTKTSSVDDAVSWYSEDGHEQMNEYLRKSKLETWEKPQPKDYLGIGVDTEINKLDKAFAKAPPLSSEIKVVRGIDDGGLSVFSKLKPGDQFVDHGYTSTTLDPGVAKQFGKTIRMQITVPKGKRALFLDWGEAEVLLPRGSQFKVTGTYQEDGTNFVQVTLL